MLSYSPSLNIVSISKVVSPKWAIFSLRYWTSTAFFLWWDMSSDSICSSWQTNTKTFQHTQGMARPPRFINITLCHLIDPSGFLGKTDSRAQLRRGVCLGFLCSSLLLWTSGFLVRHCMREGRSEGRCSFVIFLTAWIIGGIYLVISFTGNLFIHICMVDI